MSIRSSRTSVGRLITVDLTNTAEKYVKFANWCHVYKVRPHAIALIIQAINDYPRVKSWEDKNAIKEKIRRMLSDMGFTHIRIDVPDHGSISNIDVVFRHVIDGDHDVKLPIDKF